MTANFAIDRFSLTYLAGDHGAIVGDASQQVDFGGTGSEVTAVPAADYRFVAWSDGSTVNPRSDANITTDLAVTARFESSHYSLTYTAGPNGTIQGESPQRVDPGGDGTPVAAVPAPNYHFTAWSDGVATARRTDRKVAADIAVTANFAIDRHTLTYQAQENGSISGTSVQKIDHGGAGSPVEAKPAEGYHFAGWSDGSTANPRSDAKVKADLKVTASFARDRYTLTYTAGANGSLEGASPQAVEYGSNASTVKAVAAKGFHFVRWSDGVTSASRTDAKVSGDLTVSAQFAVNTYAIGGRVAGLVKGTRLVLQNNGADDLAITDNGDFRFDTESLTAKPYKVTVLSQPTGPNQTCSLGNGTGQVADKDVSAIQVSCVINTYAVGGTIAGLPAGDAVVLQNNDGEKLRVAADGPFTFAKPLDDGSSYQVKVAAPPKKPHWTCDVNNAAGVMAGRDVTEVAVDCYPQVILQTDAGLRKIRLDWNKEDFSGVTFNLCRAEEAIPAGSFQRCKELKGGVLTPKVTAPLSASPVVNDVPYWFQLEASYANGRQTLSKVVTAMAYGGLNDTGIDFSSDDDTNYFKKNDSEKFKALAAAFPGQDAVQGRDAAAKAHRLKKSGTGPAGFDFTKLCRSGEAAGEGKCPPNPQPGNGRNNWGCIRDNVTGLTWEIKTEDGLQGQDNTYSWYNPTGSVNGGGAGVQNGGKCTGSACDTLSYVNAVREVGLCGYSDWRLPTRRELLSIVDNSRYKPAVNNRYFPHATSSHYWSSLPYPDQGESAWQVYFLYGEASSANKSQKNYVRLVRGRTGTFGLDNP